MHGFWGGVLATVGNYMIVTAILNLLFDNETTASRWQTDSARIYRDDDIRPVKNPTTSGYGIDVNWQNVVYGYQVSGGLTTADKNDIIAGVIGSTEITSIQEKTLILEKMASNDATITDNIDGTRTVRIYNDDGTTLLKEFLLSVDRLQRTEVA